MKKILWFLIIIPAALVAQPQARHEIREFNGTVRKIGHMSIGLASETLDITVDGKEESFLFRRYYGRFIIDNFKAGDAISVRVNVNVLGRERFEKIRKEGIDLNLIPQYLYRDYITEVKVKGEWIPLPLDEKKENLTERRRNYVFLDREVIEIYKEGDRPYAFIFKDGITGNFYSHPSLKKAITDIRKGDFVSFIGSKLSGGESVYGIPEIKSVYFFGRLFKVEGTIKSFLYKQNYACVGMVLTTYTGEVKVSFPSDHAVKIQKLAQPGIKLIAYHGIDFSPSMLKTPPSLQALISGSDTLKIERIFFGGEDVAHEHIAAQVSGKISKINKSDKGKIMNVIIGDDIYIEIDGGTADQIISYLKKGVEIDVTGDERVKKEGEIYQKTYRIITPKRVKVNGKEFLLR